MKHHRCRYCRQGFQANRYHPQQRVCNQPACQNQRRSDYHRQRMASDLVYRQVCLVRESGARRTQGIGRNTVRTTLGRRNGIVSNSACGTKSGGWRILQTTPWLPANCLVFNHLCLRILANNILLVLLQPLGYKLAHAVRVGKLRSSFIG